ncbi:hypothetical protein BJV82DRAFT_664429 [Fennellomyces sp. T-0311]|nr:hypothetical protein BJV82DRAFT_664429 [Fennellomyces sp. T-0311]
MSRDTIMPKLTTAVIDGMVLLEKQAKQEGQASLLPILQDVKDLCIRLMDSDLALKLNILHNYLHTVLVGKSRLSVNILYYLPACGDTNARPKGRIRKYARARRRHASHRPFYELPPAHSCRPYPRQMGESLASAATSSSRNRHDPPERRRQATAI